MAKKTAYDTAIEADEAFVVALEAQYGTRDRWAVRHAPFNAATQAAYEAKIAADQALHNALRGAAQ